MNTKLLRRVKRTILAEPRRLDMDVSFAKSSEMPCGTTACIAGWALILSERKGRESFKHTRERLAIEAEGPDFQGPWDLCEPRARKLLGITWWQAKRLFYDTEWPEELYRAHYEAVFDQDYKRVARVAAKRIELFIKTGGRE